MSGSAFQPFPLRNGTKLKNRIVKAAMEEKLADVANRNHPSPQLNKLYGAWAQGGAGMILSGHIMIDPKSMGAPGDVLLAEDAGPLDEMKWKSWIAASRQGGAQFWLQINHPGRQIQSGSGLPTYGPSAVALDMGILSRMFDTPIEMTEDQILDVIRRFAWTSRRAEQLGADGVEIHAAHGYLISQFLSPLSNQRGDRWGGSLENRARLLFETIKAVRNVVSPSFGVGVKINTADFQRGGFEAEDLYWVFERLDKMQIDFVEISGGSYAAPTMITGHTSSTALREAYFLTTARKLQEIGTVPIVVTGGIRHLDTLRTVVSASDRFLAGIGTAMGLLPDLPLLWAEGKDPAPETARSWVLSKPLAATAKTACVQYNMSQISCGGRTWHGIWPTFALVPAFRSELAQMGIYKQWVSKI